MNAVDRGDFRIERREQQLLVEHQHRDQHHQRDRRHHHDVLRRHPEDVAEQRRFEIPAERSRFGDQRHTQRKRRRGDDPDRRIRPDPALSRRAIDQQRREESPHPCADEEVDPNQVTHHRPAEYGVRQPVPDVAHLPQHDVDAHQAAQRTDDQRRDQAVAEEFVLQWFSQILHLGLASPLPASAPTDRRMDRGHVPRRSGCRPSARRGAPASVPRRSARGSPG